MVGDGEGEGREGNGKSEPIAKRTPGGKDGLRR